MPYENIPGIGATYLDGAFRTIQASDQPRILILGSAASGEANRLFQITNVQTAEDEFGSDSEIMKGVHEAIEQGADNIACMRIGGRRGVLTHTASGITLSPERRDQDSLARYGLAIKAGRVVVADIEAEMYVFDSDEELVLDLGLVEISGGFAGGVNVGLDDDNELPASPADFESFASLAAGDGFTAVEGNDGLAMGNRERLVALENAYQFLDYQDADMIIPMGVTADDDTVGEMWKFLYRGTPYVYFRDVGGGNDESHEDITGEAVPDAVAARFALEEDAEWREANFAHQLAYACHRASTTWSTTLGLISVSAPAGYSRAQVAEWVGQEPKYSMAGSVLSIEEAGDNGEGLLGLKYHAGAHNYRSAKVPESLTDGGLAYGGYILTDGAALPTTEPYGVNDNDEATDAKGEPIDLGKYLLVCASWPILSNSYNGGSQYRGNLCGTVAGKVAVTPENEEPIGVNGVVVGVRRPPRMRTPLINSLAKLRLVTTRREEGLGHILVSVKTAAHPDSDFSRLSTIRAVNREVSGIREICKPYIGKEFSATSIESMKTAIDAFLKDERSLGMNQGAVANVEFTRADRIMGRLTIRLKMIPPFSIEAITIVTSLAADESDL